MSATPLPAPSCSNFSVGAEPLLAFGEEVVEGGGGHGVGEIGVSSYGDDSRDGLAFFDLDFFFLASRVLEPCARDSWRGTSRFSMMAVIARYLRFWLGTSVMSSSSLESVFRKRKLLTFTWFLIWSYTLSVMVWRDFFGLFPRTTHIAGRGVCLRLLRWRSSQNRCRV